MQWTEEGDKNREQIEKDSTCAVMTGTRCDDRFLFSQAALKKLTEEEKWQETLLKKIRRAVQARKAKTLSNSKKDEDLYL